MRISLVALFAAITLTACGSTPTAAPEASTPSSTSAVSTTATTPAPTTTAPAPVALTPQGFVAKTVGQLAGFDCSTSSIADCGVGFTVDKIETNPPCAQYGKPAAASRKIVLLTISMTTRTFSEAGAGEVPFLFIPNALKGIGPDGLVSDAQPGTCTDQVGRLSTTILPNSKYAGTVEVDVPEGATLIASTYRPTRDGRRGWVWTIG